LRSQRLSGKLLDVNTELTDSPEAAARFIKNGGIVAFPTETVYGLGADVFNETAVGMIFRAKRRPADNPLIAHVGDLAQIARLTPEVPRQARLFIEAFFPGPLTLVLKRAANVPLIATAGLDTIGVRMPRSRLANAFLCACETPVVAPSANLSGKPSPTTWRAVHQDLNGRVDCILQGEPTEIGLESTVVDCTGEHPVVLRAGAVYLETLKDVVPDTHLYGIADDLVARSPGMRHKHYAPDAAVLLIDSPAEIDAIKGVAYIGIESPNRPFERVLVCSTVDEYARGLFAFFRECDNAGVRMIYCQTVKEEGIGTALMDRLRRAAAG
jgi:L-threonylcarbamoyladenylate synthase